MTRNRTVSAVIPTRNRPRLVQRAVRSALAQKYDDLEVIAVIDGPDSATEKVLTEISDKRLRVIVLRLRAGARSGSALTLPLSACANSAATPGLMPCARAKAGLCAASSMNRC